MTDYRQTHSWTSAVALGPQLVRVAEELPAHEQTGLMMVLNQTMVELPAMIALDLTRGSDLRFAAHARLVAALALIDSVYPALDTAGVRTDLDALGERLSGPGFNESSVAITPAPPAPTPALPEPAPAPTSVTVTPEESVHVQPDSV